MASTLKLDTPVQYVKGVGPTRAAQLADLGVATLGDLLTYYPRRFDLRRQVLPMNSLVDNQEFTVAGEVTGTNERRGGRLPYFECCIKDDTGWAAVKWFHGGYLRDQIKVGMQIAISGRTSTYKEAIQFINPKFQIIWDPEHTDLSQDQLMPVYPASGTLPSGVIGLIIKKLLPLADELIPEWFDSEYLQKRNLMRRPAAVVAMHHPEDKDHWSAARRRLAYDECFLMQLGIAIMRSREISRQAHALRCSEQIDTRIRARFPFPLTDAQNRAVTQIVTDLAKNRPMNRLLQGDVGSGKTVVALYAALLAVANHKQAAIMAPTEILAVQHYRKLTQYLAGSKVNVAMLVGGQDDRDATLAGLADGSINIVVGTHALLGESVQFSDLALVVVDEQHKFGVKQRSGIRGKGFAPHYLVMTATPIPRTLAMTVFGDLDVSTIDSLPPGRGKTTTRCVSQEKLADVLKLVEQKLAQGQQAYFIYPLVNQSEDGVLTAADEAHRQLSAGPLGKYGVGLIHGQMPAEQKDAVMRDFNSGKIRALAASVVVEVGLDVPNANVMVIMHAERFGLAQLHQLRGRIGRGKDDAVCILVASPNNPQAQRRLEVLESSCDGFKIAEEDLRIRGPGEIFGTAQHGLPDLKVADLVEDFELLRMSRRDAFEVIDADVDLCLPHHQQIRSEMIAAYAGKLNLLSGA